MRDNWVRRRKVVFGTLYFCAAVVTYTMVKTYGLNECQDSRVAETALNGAFLLAGGVVGSYVFGAVWDDSNKMKAKTGEDDEKGA